MKNSSLPDIMLGSWIWSSDGLNQPLQEHALFRRDFILDSAPSSAEINIVAQCSYQIFINGRFSASGPTPCPTGNLYVCKYDISHLMQIGANSIAIKAACDAKPATSRPPRKPGFWLQLVADNMPILWTDQKWLAYPLNAYLSTELQASPAETSIEILDYRTFPQNWLLLTQKHFSPDENQMPDETEWQKVTNAWPLNPQQPPMELEPKAKRSCEPIPEPKLICRGIASIRNCVFTLDFSPFFLNATTPGTYVAEAYFNLEEGMPDTLFCFSSTSYKLFINNKLAVQQGDNTPRPNYTCGANDSQACHRLYNTQDSCEVELQAGWNKIVVVKHCSQKHSPFTLIFGNQLQGDIVLMRQPDLKSQQGWSISGPIRTPMPLVPESFSLQSLPKLMYHDEEELAIDAAAVSLACQFELDKDAPQQQKLPIPLAQGQTLIFDFGKTIYAVPQLKLSGQSGDILDLVAGEHLIDHEVIALENGIRRNVSTIILGDCPKPIYWLLEEEKGFRYLMLTARTTRTVINLMGITAYTTTTETNARGSFECDDEILNAVWKVGLATLGTTFQGRFMDSPTKDQTQCIPDTMIQSMSAYFTHGAYQQAAYALESFARTQLEIGEINALTPSSFFQTIPDFSLMWPVWLQKHILYTADARLLQKLLPNLTALLDYYDSLAVEPNGPLGQISDVVGNPPFIDVDNIDTRGISTALNAIYCRALFAAAWLAEFSNDQEQAAIYTHRAAKVAGTIRTLCWNPEQNLYADCYVDAALSPFSSWQANVLAIYGGIATPEQIPVLWQQIFSSEPPFESFAQGDFNNPYFKYFILDCAFANGYTAWGLDLIRFYWGKMIDAGATTFWELFDPDNPSLESRICSHCQGYATSPNAFLISEVAGIRPSSSGMNSLIFSPDLEDIKWCRASIPTPLGTIQLAWELRVNDTLEIAITANHPIDIIPVLSPRFAENAIFNVSDTVSVLAADESDLPEESPEDPA